MTDTTPTTDQARTDGAELVDSAVLAQLRKDAADANTARAEAARLRHKVAEGDKARAELTRTRHEALITDAIKAGKFGPARKAAWMKALTIDEAGTLADLEAMPAGLIPVTQLGDAGDPDTDSAIYDRAFGSKEN